MRISDRLDLKIAETWLNMVLHGFGKFVINRAMLDITRLVGLELNLLFVYSKCPF